MPFDEFVIKFLKVLGKFIENVSMETSFYI